MSKGGRYVHRPRHPKASEFGMVHVDDLGDEAPQEAAPRLQVMTDSHYQGVRSPIDGTPLESRTAHRAYMKANGLVLADDCKGQWEKQAKERADFSRTGKTPGVDWGKRLAETHEKLSRRR